MEIGEENGERIIEEKMEQEETAVDKSEPDIIDEDETLLAQDPGEEDEEDEEDVEENVTDELLKEETETMQQEEVTLKEIDEEVMLERVEQRGGVEVTTFLKVKDPTDPLNVNQSNNFGNLAINDPKDIEMSDPGTTDHNENSTHNSRQKPGLIQLQKPILAVTRATWPNPLTKTKPLLLTSI